MNLIRFEEISEDNISSVLALEVKADQKDFLPDIQSSLDIAERYESAEAVAICTQSNAVIGFALYGIDEQTENWKIFRMMIDQQYQRQGFGTLATRKLIEILKEKPDSSKILICYQKSNPVAQKLYQKLGFQEYRIEGTKVFAELSA